MALTTEIQEQILHKLENDPVASDVQATVVRLHDQLSAVIDDAPRHLLDELVEALGQYRDRVELHAFNVGLTTGEARATSLRAVRVELQALTTRLEQAATRLESGS